MTKFHCLMDMERIGNHNNKYLMKSIIGKLCNFNIVLGVEQIYERWKLIHSPLVNLYYFF